VQCDEAAPQLFVLGDEVCDAVRDRRRHRLVDQPQPRVDPRDIVGDYLPACSTGRNLTAGEP
jgi:hypothetical protein